MLKASQAQWAEFIADYDLEIAFNPGFTNGKADALIQREEDTVQLKKLKKDSRNQVLLKSSKLDRKMVAEIKALSANPPTTTTAPISDIKLTGELLAANKSDPELSPPRQEQDRAVAGLAVLLAGMAGDVE